MSSIMKGIVDEGATNIAGLMTNFDDPNNLTIRDPDTWRYIPAKQYFQSHPEQQLAWQSAWEERLNKQKQQTEYKKLPKVPHPYRPNSQVTPDEANTISSEMASRYLSPEEQQKYKTLYAKDQFAAGRFLKQVWNKKTDQKQFANLLKVHWTSVNKLNDFLTGKIPNKAELSAVMYKSAQELPIRPSWGTGSDQVGLILDGWTTIAGRQDLSSDNQRVGKSSSGVRSHQKYTHEPESVYLEPSALRTTKAELGTGWNEALVDNWKVKGIVVPQGASEETINMVKQTKLPITYTGQTRESSIMKGIVDESDWTGGIINWKKEVTSKHGPDVTFKKRKLPGVNGKTDTYATNSQGKVVGVYQHHNDMGRVLSETDAIKGADGKRCWKGKRYAGTENGKDKCIPVKEFAGDEKSEQPRQEHPITVYIHSIVDNATIALIGEKMSELKHGKIKTQFTLPNSGTTYTEWLPVVDKKYPTGKLSSNVNLSSSQMPSVRLNDGVFLYWAYDPQLSEGDVVPFKKKTDKDKYNTAIAKQRGSLPISYIDPDAGITVKSTKPGDPIQIPDEYQDINLKSKIRGVPKQNQTNFEVWGNDHGYYVFGNNTNAVLSAWPNGEMMVLSDPSDSKGRENCQRFAKQVMKPIDLDSLRPKLKNKILQKMSMIDQSVNEGVIVGHDAKDPEVAILGGAGTMSLSRLKKKAQGEAEQLANDLARGRFKAAAYNIKQLENTLKTIVAAEDEMSKKYFGENAWNQLGQRKPNTNLPAPERGSRVNHGKRFEEGDIVLPLSGPLKGQPHKVIHSQRTSIRIVPLGRDSYPGDTIAPRTKHEWVVPADTNEDYTGEFAAEVTPAINPYGGLKDRQHRGAISEMPDTSGPVGTQEGGWRRTDMEEGVDDHYKLADVLDRLMQYSKEVTDETEKNRAIRAWNAINYWYGYSNPNKRDPNFREQIISGRDLLRTGGLGKTLAATVDNAMGFAPVGFGIPMSGRGRSKQDIEALKNDANKIADAMSNAVKQGNYEIMGKLAGQLNQITGTIMRLSKTNEDTAYAGGMGQGGNAGESYRKFKPKSAGTFNESACRDCKHGYPADICPECEDEYKEKQEKAKKKSTVKKESSIMKGLKR